MSQEPGSDADLRDGDVKVKAKTEDRSSKEDDKDGVCGILKVRRLNLHASELNAPADGRPWRRRLETECLPIRRLDVLEK